MKELFSRSKQKDRNGKHYIVFRNICRKCWSKYILSKRTRPGARDKDCARQREYSKTRKAKARWKVVLPGGKVIYFQIERCARKRAEKDSGQVVLVS